MACAQGGVRAQARECGAHAVLCGRPSVPSIFFIRLAVHPGPLIGPFEGVYTDNKDLFRIFLHELLGSIQRVFGFSLGPGGFTEVREASRNPFHLSWYL